MSANPSTLIALASFVGTDHILFGTDYPFMPESETADTIAGLGEFFGRPALPAHPQPFQHGGRGRVPRIAAGRDPVLAPGEQVAHQQAHRLGGIAAGPDTRERS
jgi:hypothetical protein